MAKVSKRMTPSQKLVQDLRMSIKFEAQANQEQSNSPEARAIRKYHLNRARHRKEEFAAGLREQRESQGLTQAQLAEKARLTVEFVAAVECLEKYPTTDEALRLVIALGFAAEVYRYQW
jgi:ribosome-binding protein aMBF1 (putative translation factor)